VAGHLQLFLPADLGKASEQLPVETLQMTFEEDALSGLCNLLFMQIKVTRKP